MGIVSPIEGQRGGGGTKIGEQKLDKKSLYSFANTRQTERGFPNLLEEILYP